MTEAGPLKDRIGVLRKILEEEYLSENYDKEKLLKLSVELDKLIYEFLLNEKMTG